MKISGGRNKAVSEVIGTMFVFAIFISLLTTITLWYIPATETSSEQNFQSDALSAMSSLTSELSSPDLQTGTLINQNIPMGISGGFFLPSSQTSLTYSPNGFSGSLQYDLGISFKYTNGHPTAGVLNKIVGTFPQQVVLNSSSEVYVPGATPYIYVAGNSSNNIAVINANTGAVLRYIYAGNNPVAMAFDPVNGYVFVADYYTTGTHSTVSYINSNGEYAGNISTPIKNPTTISYGGYGGGSVYIASAQNGVVLRIDVSSTSSSNWAVSGTQANTGSFTHSLISYNSNNANYPVVTLNNKSKGNGLDSYTVYSGSLSTSTKINLQITHNNKLRQGALSGLALYNDIMYISISNTTVGHGNKLSGYSGILSTVYGTATSSTEVANITGIPTKLALDPVSLQLGVVVQTNQTLDQVLSFSIVSSSLGLGESGNVSTSRISSDIIYVQNTTGGTTNFFFATSSQVNEVNKISVDATALNVLNLTRVIYCNFFENPTDSVYNPLNKHLYVSNYGSGTVSIISPFNESLLGKVNLGLGTYPTKLAVNLSTGLVYAIETETSSLAVINGSTLEKTIPLSYKKNSVMPTDVVYDSYTGTVYVSANYFGKSTSTDTGMFFNVSSLSGAPSYKQAKQSGLYQSLAFDPFLNQTYAVVNTTGSYYLLDISSSSLSYSKITTPNANYGTYTLAFNSYTGTMFAAYAIHGQYGYLQVFNGTSATALTKAWKTIRTGGEPTGPVFDAGNNLVYVPNYASINPKGIKSGIFTGSGNNLTVIDGVKGTYITTIWAGAGPENACFNPDNGYIYIPDSFSEKITVIDGGFTVFNGRAGIFVTGSSAYSGSITVSANTQYVNPASYTAEGNLLVKNLTDSNSIQFEGSPPLVITNNSGRVYLSAAATGLLATGSSTSNSLSSSSPTDLQLKVLDKLNSTYYVGSHFFVTDPLGNKWEAVVTDIYLENFQMTFTTSFAKNLNSYFYSIYNGSLSSAPGSWNFENSALPLIVHYTSSSNTVTVSSNTKLTPSLYSATLLYYELGLIKL